MLRDRPADTRPGAGSGFPVCGVSALACTPLRAGKAVTGFQLGHAPVVLSLSKALGI